MSTIEAIRTTHRQPGVSPLSEPPDLPQYSGRKIAAVWAASTIPMSVLGWGVAPWLSHHIGGRDPFVTSLLICFDVGLTWMVLMTMALVRREQGSLAWPRVRDALWLRAPRDPRSGPDTAVTNSALEDKAHPGIRDHDDSAPS